MEPDARKYMLKISKSEAAEEKQVKRLHSVARDNGLPHGPRTEEQLKATDGAPSSESQRPWSFMGLANRLLSWRWWCVGGAYNKRSLWRRCVAVDGR